MQFSHTMQFVFVVFFFFASAGVFFCYCDYVSAVATGINTSSMKNKQKKKRTHKQQQKNEKTSRHKQHNALPDGAVGALQFCSSDLSPQSSAPSQIQSLLTHAPLAQVI